MGNKVRTANPGFDGPDNRQNRTVRYDGNMKTDHCADQLKTPSSIMPIGDRPWAARALASFICGVGIMLTGQAHAHESHELAHADNSLAGMTTLLDPAEDITRQYAKGITFSTSSQDNYPYVDLGVIDSRPGEEKQAYLHRVGQVLNDFTLASGHEACGAIMENEEGDAWRVRLTTNRSQFSCVKMIFQEEGYLLTDETIHSHPQPKRDSLWANAQDEKLLGFPCGHPFRVHDADFSDGDLRTGAGYLVARGRLLYHRNGVKLDLGEVPKADTSGYLAHIPNDTGRMKTSGDTRTMVAKAMVEASAWSSKDGKGLPSVSCKVKTSR